MPALQGVDVELEPGDCLLVVGPSGSGKSTLGLALAGLIPREIPGEVAGSLAVDGRETASFDPAELAAAVGLVFQDAAVQLVMDRVEDEIAFGLENRGWPRDRMRSRVPEALASVGLAGLERWHARELSGGQQQRLALAGVLAAEPGILVLDEPTANLDPTGAAAFLEGIADLRARRAATIVLIDHRLEAAWGLADEVLALGTDGAPIAVGAPKNVLRRARAKMAAAGIWLPEPARARAIAAAAAIGVAGSPGVEGIAGSSGVEGISGVPDAIGRQVLEARDLRYGYHRGTAVLREIDLVAAEGERIALVGPNGSGKSTLGRLLVGLLRPKRGTVRLNGHDPARLAPAVLSRLAGYVFQRPEQQFLAQRVADEVALGLRAGEFEEAARLMDRLGLPLGTFGERSPYRLSGGEQRRLSLACALVRRPSLLILDEPTYGQDRRGYESLLAILRGMISEGTCLIAATHDPRFVQDVAGRIVTLHDGWLVGDEPAPAPKPGRRPGDRSRRAPG